MSTIAGARANDLAARTVRLRNVDREQRVWARERDGRDGQVPVVVDVVVSRRDWK